MTAPLSRRATWVLLLVGIVLLALFATIWMAAPARAQDIEAETATLADQVGLDPLLLQGALNTTGAAPRTYLIHEGLLTLPAPPTPAVGVWDALARCESGGDWSAVSRSGVYRGGLQFDQQTWLAYGGGQYASSAHLASRAQQIAIAERLSAARGFAPWPLCRWRIGR